MRTLHLILPRRIPSRRRFVNTTARAYRLPHSCATSGCREWKSRVRTVRGTLGAVGTIGPAITGRFHVTFLQCAHPILTIGSSRLWNPLRFRTLAARLRFFEPVPSTICPCKKNSQDRQVLAQRILTDRGEVAEWPKAAVC